MFKKTALTLVACIVLSACAADKPRIVQATGDIPQIRLTSGMATQVEVPNSSGRVQSVVVGNPNIVTADHTDNIVNLVPKEGSGETNLIVRAMNDSGESEVYQYRILVQGQ